MHRGIAWCPHCGQPHKLKTTICPTTGHSLERSMHRAADSHALLGVTIDGRYRVLRILGRGGLGIVFEAENLQMRRLVAVKVANERDPSENFERLSREAHIIASLQHPNICDIYDYGWYPGHGPYLVTERLFGETLGTRMVRRRVMPIAEAIDILSQVLCGLHAAHARQIVHRDLKPSNVFLVDRLNCAPLVKIVDFGLARDLSADARTKLTRPGKAAGTAHYMSPEQLEEGRVGTRSDLFAIGVMAYQMLAGVHPFAADSIVETQTRILKDAPDPLRARRPDVTRRLESVVMRALEKDPRARFADAISMQRALLECLPKAPQSYDEPEPLSEASSG